MGATAEQLILTAEGDVNKTRDQVNCSGTHDWCAQYMSRILERNEYDIEETFVTPLHTKLLSTGLWEDIDTPQRGAFIFFDWNHIVEERPLDHVGIISSVNGSTIRYVNGNALPDRSIVSYSEISIDDDDIIYITQLKGSGGSFFTDKCLYDISAAQWDDTTLVERIASHAETGGFIIKYGQVNDIDNPYEAERLADNINVAKAHNLAIGFYFYWNTSPDDVSDDKIKNVFTTGLGYLSDKNISASDVVLGMWLDFEDNAAASADKSKNAHVVDLFMEVCTIAGYPISGLYTYRAYVTAHFNLSEIKDKPFWYSRPGESRATVDDELAEWGFTKAYLWQDGYPGGGYAPGKTYYFSDVDNDTQLMPIPTSGGGGGTVTAVTVSVVAPKRIYFSPNPDVFLGESEFLNISQEITITTDADNAEIYYTIDGSSPYQYQRIVGNESWQYSLSNHAIKYTAPVEIKTDTHFRVIAVPTGTESAIDPLLAKGSGTFLFNFTPTSYSWEQEQYAYRLTSEDKKVKYFEENRQAFLRYHAEETAEEILYNTVIAASEQSSGTVQPESGDADEGGHADDDI